MLISVFCARYEYSLVGLELFLYISLTMYINSSIYSYKNAFDL